MKQSSFRPLLQPCINIPPIKDNPNFAAEYLINTQTDKHLVTDMYYKMSGPDFGELSFREFILLLIKEIKRGRRYGYVRLFLYPKVEDFIANGSKYFPIFIKKKDIYVVGLEDIDGTLYEVGKADEPGRYFYHSIVTGFGQRYRELFQGSEGKLEGVWIGFHQLNKAILKIIQHRDPLTRNCNWNWAWGIGQFALTFSECARFVWYHVVMSNLMEEQRIIPMEKNGKYYYMSVLPKEWLNISNCARGTPMVPITNLNEIIKYAKMSLHIQSWDYDDAKGDCCRAESYEQGGGVGRGYGDGGGCYGDYAGGSCPKVAQRPQYLDFVIDEILVDLATTAILSESSPRIVQALMLSSCTKFSPSCNNYGGRGGGEGGDDGGGQGPEGGYDRGGLRPGSRDVDHGVGGYHGGRNNYGGRGRNNYGGRGRGKHRGRGRGKHRGRGRGKHRGRDHITRA